MHIIIVNISLVKSVHANGFIQITPVLSKDTYSLVQYTKTILS